MRLHYYSEIDSLYIEFKPIPGTATREIVGGLNVDLDAEDVVVGLDIDYASRLWTSQPSKANRYPCARPPVSNSVACGAPEVSSRRWWAACRPDTPSPPSGGRLDHALRPPAA